MKSISVDIPPSLRILNPPEVRSIAIRMIHGTFKREDLSEIVATRYRTKHSANTIARNVTSDDLAQLEQALINSKDAIDFQRAYILSVNEYMLYVLIRQ